MADNTDWKARAEAAESAVGVLLDLIRRMPQTLVAQPGEASSEMAQTLADLGLAAAARDARLQRKAERDIVEDAMALLYMAPREDETTMDAFRRLIDAEQAVALDPAVSAEARALIERGRREGIEEAARFVGTNVHQTIATAIRALLDKPAGEDGR